MTLRPIGTAVVAVVTLMTAGLVLIIWGLAGPALSGVFQQAMDRVSTF